MRDGRTSADALSAYDPRRDRPALLDCLIARFAQLPPSGARRLAQGFCRLVPARASDATVGLVLRGGTPAFAFVPLWERPACANETRRRGGRGRDRPRRSP